MKSFTKNFTQLSRMSVAVICLLLFYGHNTDAQNVGIADSPFTPDAHSMLEVQSNSKGILIPRMTDVERVAITPTVGDNFGLLVYQTNTLSTDNAAGYWYWDGYNWTRIGNGNSWSINGNAGTNPNNNFIGTTDASDFALRTDNTERARIDAVGNFGIGTAYPSQLLSVATGMNVDNNNTNNGNLNNALVFGGAGSGEGIASKRTPYGNQYGLDFYTSGTTQMSINPIGNVGIGTTIPYSKLEVQNPSLYPGASITNSLGSNGTDALQVVHYGTGNGIYNYTSGVTAAGYVGIQGGVWPGLGWYSLGSVVANLNSGIGVYTGGRNIGVLACAMEDGNTTTDQLGGVFYTQNSAGNGWPSAACIGSVVDNIVYKVFGWGIVSTVVQDTQNKPVVMAAPEAPEALFQDYGTGKLSGGKVHINLDPILSKNITVDEKHPIKVFIQMNENCNGVFVNDKTGSGFDVEELNNGASDASFSWMVVATRKNETRGGVTSDYESFRFKRTYNAAFNGIAANH